nr:Asparagine--tRNA ligase [Chlamydiota bacterium]
MRIKIKKLKFPKNGDKSYVDEEVNIKGWIRSVRKQKTFSFIEMNDGSTLTNFQVVFDSSHPKYPTLIERLNTGVSISATGKIVSSPGKKQSVEMNVSEIEIIGTCDPENYPLQKKRHSFEFLRTIAHLRPRTNTLGAVTRVRNALAFATHLFFQEKGFLYINTPIITGSDCEGAGELFQITRLDMENLPKKEDG